VADQDYRLFYATKECGCVVAALVYREHRHDADAATIGSWTLDGYKVSEQRGGAVTVHSCPHTNQES
jgi:hypothetical protein